VHEKAMQSAAFSIAFSYKEHTFLRHLACVLPKIRAKSGKMAGQIPLTSSYFPATTPCENELFMTNA